MEKQSKLFDDMMSEYRKKETHELAGILGVEMKKYQTLPLEAIIGNVSPIQQPVVKAAIGLYERLGTYKRPAPIRGIDDVIPILRSVLTNLEHGDEVWCITLDRMRCIKSIDAVFFGKFEAARFASKFICKTVIENKGESVIVAQSCKDDELIPSKEVIDQVKKVKNALSSIEVGLIDHVMVTNEGVCYSFAEEKCFK